MKTFKSIRITAVIAMLIFLTSCASVYIPNKVNLPNVSEQGDAVVNASFGQSGLDFQGNVAVTENIGVMLNSSFALTSISKTDEYEHKHTFVEAGAGYFIEPLESNIFSIYGGLGFGSVYTFNSVVLGPRTLETNFHRVFLQPSYSINSEYFTFNIGVKMVGLNLHETIYSGNYFLLEPAFEFKVGTPEVRLTTQFGFSYNVAYKIAPLEYRPLLFSIGLELNIHEIFYSKNF